MNPQEASVLLCRLLERAELVEPGVPDEQDLRDRNDLLVLGTLVASSANYLITGDKELLALSAKYPILTPAEFLSRFTV
jgi:putative PIN family toxin of toxin-antitoxin system